MVVSAIEGHRVWSRQYDGTPNPILALEMRVLSPRLGGVAGQRILDAGSGTGRWMAWAEQRGARVFGVDACREMLLESARKPGLAGRAALAELTGARGIPIGSDAVDIAICSFTLGYLPSPGPLLRELARVSRFVIVSDLHPAAVRQGWTRSFRARGERYEMARHEHSIAELDEAAKAAGLVRKWRIEPPFGEPEREIFQRAGKEAAFDEASRLQAILITAWNKPSD
jgi:SAM-dependent methyltransferase